ncbi:MAG: trypsin-like peptidase domain-containing protein [Pirellula sp.]|jgi:S1-C subfamily serine protease
MNGRIWLLMLGLVLSGSVKASGEPLGDCVGIFFFKADSRECLTTWPAIQEAIRAGWAIRTSNIEQEPDLAKRMQIRSLPTLLLLRNGREVDRILGATSLRDIEHRMTAASSPDSLNQTRDASSEPGYKVRGQSQGVSIPMAPQVALASHQQAFPNVPAQNNATLVPNVNGVSTLSQVMQSQSLDNRPPSDPAGATVRIRVDEPSHEAIGTGTIIDTYNGEALVLTCGHLFRDTHGTTPIIVETFIGGQPRTYQAWLIDYRADETDIGLISFRPEMAVPVARLMDHRETLREGDPVFSWGCDNGALPSKRDSRISKLNRYLGPANVEVAGKPVQGRSGGGLFNSRGELIGVCYAADDELDEGLYNAPEIVYAQLLKLGLRRLFEQQMPVTSNVVNASDGSIPSVSPSLVESISLASANVPQPPPPPRNRRMIVTLEENGQRQQIEIYNPSPTLIDAIQSQRMVR